MRGSPPLSTCGHSRGHLEAKPMEVTARDAPARAGHRGAAPRAPAPRRIDPLGSTGRGSAWPGLRAL